jgi:hypothetical protein
MLGPVLIVILIIMLVGTLPRWGYSKNWNHYPSSTLGLVLFIVIILVLVGRI